MSRRTTPLVGAVVLSALVNFSSRAYAWDHPGHMTTAAIAFAEIERARPDLVDKLGLLFLTHPDPAPFWVAAGEAKGQERVRRMFIECARWADDSKFTSNDRLTWHSARWSIVAKDAPPEAKAAAAARNGKPAGDPDVFMDWTKESHRVAVDWAFDLETAPDPNKDQPAEKLVQNMINFILNGVSPVAEAPELPPGYWERLQSTAERRIALAGYRIADIILAAAEQIEAQRKFMGR